MSVSERRSAASTDSVGQRLAGLADQAQAIVAPFGYTVGALYLLLAVTAPWAIEGPSYALGAVWAVSAVAFAGLGWYAGRHPSARIADPAFAGMAVIAYVDAGILLAATGEAVAHLIFVVTTLGVAVVMMSLRWYLIATIAGALVWMLATGSLAFSTLTEAPEALGRALASATFLLFAIVLGAFGQGLRVRAHARVVGAEQAHGQYTAIVRSAGDAILSVDPSGTILTWNPGAQAVFGYTPHEAIGANVDMLKADEHDGDDLLARARGGDDPPATEALCRRKDGALLHTQVRVSPIRDPDGQVVAVSIVARDVTKELQAERELRLLWENSLDLLAVADTSGHFTRLNPRWQKVLGWTPEELMERPFADFVHPDDVDRTNREAAGLAEGKESVQFENRYRCKDGSYRWILWNSRFDPETQRIYAIARDITDLKRRQEERVEALRKDMELQRLREVDAAKTRLINATAHQLYTPMTPLMVQLHRLRKGAGDLDNAVGIMDRNLKRLQQSVKDMLTVARLQDESVRPRTRQVDLRQTLVPLLQEVDQEAERAGIELVHAVPEDVEIVVDPEGLYRAVEGLLRNAVSFTPEGGTVRVQADSGPFGVRIAVEDTGVGVPVGEEHRLFKPFEPIHDPQERTEAGPGLGLYIARGFARAHGGDLRYERPDTGSRFVLELPREPPDASPAAPAQTA